MVLLGANGAGKTAVLSAVAKALGRDRTVGRRDFTDPSVPIEIRCVLADLGAELAAGFNRHLTFNGPTLTIGLNAVIDDDEIDVQHGFPNPTWTRASRTQLRSLPVVWLPAQRDPVALLRVTGAGSLLAQLIADLDLNQEIEQAGLAVAQAAQALAGAQTLRDLLDTAGEKLAAVTPAGRRDSFDLGTGPPAGLMEQLELLLASGGTTPGMREQPSGMAQLAVFAMVLVELSNRQGALLLVDEPELALHPHAQRALVAALRVAATQTLIATHSAHVLSRCDLREALRFERTAAGIAVHRTGVVTDQEERRLARYATATLVEAFFARVAILVEGPSDRLALQFAAEQLGVDLDARSVSLVELQGADVFETLRSLLGPSGLQVELRGMCDADRERRWTDVIYGPGVYNGDRNQLAQDGIFVADPDLEGALVDSLGETQVEGVITAEGEKPALDLYRQQPDKRNLPSRDQILGFLKSKDRKVRFAPLLVQAVPTGQLPDVLKGVLADL